MQSNNPVFNRSEHFRGGQSAYGNQAGGAAAYPGNDPSQWGTGAPGAPGAPTQAAPTGPMTIDTVVQKSAMTIGLVILTAAATWVVTPDVSGQESLSTLYLALMVGSFGAFGLAMVNSFKKVISPPLVLAFAVLEGVALGALSKAFQALFPTVEGLITQAVLGTFFAFAGTLAAYKFFDIQVGDKFRKYVIAGMFAMVGLGLMEFVLAQFSSDIGFLGFGPLGLLFSVAGLVLGVFMLILDFDFIEKGIANGLPEQESWRAAFALTVSLVWIYTNLLRILAILQGE